jgi:hypothetical protein
MKLKKKTTMILSFALGSLIFGTTALADIASKDGYEQLKDAIKLTADSCSDRLDSYTVDFSFVIKDNGKILTSDDQISKIDNTKKAQENLSSREGFVSGKAVYHSYSDPKIMINQSDNDATYYVTEYIEPRKNDPFENPFNDERAEDVEKIADAVIGSLKEQVIVKENPEGTKDFNGTISEVQIPTLVNAVASYMLKQDVNRPNQEMPLLAQDIFVKEVQGTAHINGEGILENILGTATIVGIDEQGSNHEVTIEVLIKLSDVNSTIVAKPDLTGKKVNKQVITRSPNGPQPISNPEKFIGKFNNDIVIEEDNKYVKIGERIIEITEIDSTHVVGRYYEEYKPGFEGKAANKQNFNFDASFDRSEKNDPSSANVEVSNDAGVKTQINLHFDEYMGKIYLGFNQSFGNQPFDSTFCPVLE